MARFFLPRILRQRPRVLKKMKRALPGWRGGGDFLLLFFAEKLLPQVVQKEWNKCPHEAIVIHLSVYLLSVGNVLQGAQGTR